MQHATSRITWNHSPRPEIPVLGTERACFRLKHQLPQLVWNAAALEGNTFTLPEVRTLLDGVTVGGKRLDEQRQILDLSAAFNLLLDEVKVGSFETDKITSDRFHFVVAQHEALDAGTFRGEGVTNGDGGGVSLMNGGFVPFDSAAQLSED